MIKYKILSDEEKELVEKEEARVNNNSGGKSVAVVTTSSSKKFPQTTAFLQEQIQEAKDLGFDLDSKVAILARPNAGVRSIELFHTDPTKCGGYTRPFFIKLTGESQLYNHDELVLVPISDLVDS